MRRERRIATLSASRREKEINAGKLAVGQIFPSNPSSLNAPVMNSPSCEFELTIMPLTVSRADGQPLVFCENVASIMLIVPSASIAQVAAAGYGGIRNYEG